MSSSSQLTSIELHGYKSIRRLDGFAFGRINVLIGPNGAGKSNLISFFRLLSWMMSGELQRHVGKAGGASALLHDGAAKTPQMQAKLTFLTEQGTNDYEIRLFHAAADTLIFADEKFRFSNKASGTKAPWTQLSAGHKESRIIELADQGNATAKTLRWLIQQCVVYQFHNTSDTARIRQSWSVDDNLYLKEDGANLAPFLLRLRETRPQAYARIVGTLRQIAPFFADFILEPSDGNLLLRWRETGSDIFFGPQQASDGTLRVMALVALLLQPVDSLPRVLILDEPELGLHPFAVKVIAGLLRSASEHVQVLLSTQSTAFIDQFEPAEIVVVDRAQRESLFHRLDPDALKDWLDEYSLSALWEKNVLGGRPA